MSQDLRPKHRTLLNERVMPQAEAMTAKQNVEALIERLLSMICDEGGAIICHEAAALLRSQADALASSQAQANDAIDRAERNNALVNELQAEVERLRRGLP
jgi:hypothetical protein